MSDRPNALPWYRKPAARYGPTNFLLDAAAKFVGQPLYDAYKGIGYAAGFEQDPNAPPGYVSHDALNRAANGIAAGQIVGSGFARAPAGALRSGAAGAELDMSQAARMQRARDMGFDTDITLYHGTGAKNFDSFDVGRSGSVQYSDWGNGVYFTPSKSTADYYRTEALKKTTDRYNDAFQRYEDLTRGTPVKNGAPQYTDEARAALAEFQAIGRELNNTDGGQILDAFVRLKRPYIQPYKSTPDPDLANMAKETGYDGIHVLRGDGSLDEVIVFDPSNIRSVNAAFDPAKSSSSNLMAADPFAGAIVPTYSQPQRRNQLPMTF